MTPQSFDFRFVSIRVFCPRTQSIVLEAQRAVKFTDPTTPDWEHVDTVVSTFLDAHDIEDYTKFPIPKSYYGGGWMTHSFDMGCPRLVWVFPDSSCGQGA